MRTIAVKQLRHGQSNVARCELVSPKPGTARSQLIIVVANMIVLRRTVVVTSGPPRFLGIVGPGIERLAA